MEETASLIFITGGVRSGKSSFAEKLATGHARKTRGQLHYIATSVLTDNEMNERILRHRRERMENELPWRTWEQPRNLHTLADKFTKDDILLLDCITTLLNNILFSTDTAFDEVFQRSAIEEIINGIKEIKKTCKTLVIVSNEVLHEALDSSELVMVYGRMLGKLHQGLVELADQAYVVEAGLPILMKGESG